MNRHLVNQYDCACDMQLLITGFLRVLWEHARDNYANDWFLPHAYAQGGEVIGLSVCLSLSQKTGIFRDLQLQASREWHKTVKIGDEPTYLCSQLLLKIHECDKL